MKAFSEDIMEFYSSLQPGFSLPEGVEIMNPFNIKEAKELAAAFYHKFYHDVKPRTFIYGINPGRFGGGVTGIPFTDPVRLTAECGIHHHLAMKPELSSVFIYEMINAFGGTGKFFSLFFLTALCPLGFTKEGKNLNYYDSKELLNDADPFIRATLRKQSEINRKNKLAYCLGEGENYKQFRRLNDTENYYERIIPLPHPRWIMQYRRKNMEQYIKLYIDTFKENL